MPVWDEDWTTAGADYKVCTPGGEMRPAHHDTDVDGLLRTKARIRLASAAPDMARALLPLLRWAEQNVEKPVPPGGNQDAALFVRVWHVEMARAALKKAGVMG